MSAAARKPRTAAERARVAALVAEELRDRRHRTKAQALAIAYSRWRAELRRPRARRRATLDRICWSCVRKTRATSCPRCGGRTERFP